MKGKMVSKDDREKGAWMGRDRGAWHAISEGRGEIGNGKERVMFAQPLTPQKRALDPLRWRDL
jgi:hypothetical protein